MSKCTLPVLEQKRTGYFTRAMATLAFASRYVSASKISQHDTWFSTRAPCMYFPLAAPRSLRLILLALILLLCSFLPNSSHAESFRGPDVVIVAEEDRIVYEFRQNGHLRYIRIVPNRGKPYYLVPTHPTKGNGNLERVESLVTSWVLWEFD
jgi:hypothetical protein